MKNKFIFSFKNVIIFVFCFVLLGSLILSLSLSKKVSGLDVSEPVGGWPEEETPEPTNGGNGGAAGVGTSINNNAPVEDIDAMPADIQVGETWTGPSGQTYIATAPNPETVAIYEASGTTPPATLLVPVSTTGGTTPDGGDKHYYCNACSGKSCVTFKYSTPCSDYCPNNCGGTTPPPATSTSATPTQVTNQCFCNGQLTGTYTCYDDGNGGRWCTECQCGGTCSVVYSYTPCSNTCSSNNDCGGGGGSHGSGGATGGTPYVPPASPPPTCQIISFTINDKDNSDQNPLIVWVNAVLRGYFSVLDSCKTCTVSSNDTWGNPLKTYSITTINSNYDETFKINTAGTYSYTLGCVGADPEDIVTDILSLQTVKALNLPWWREIIPNLTGFLKGMIR